MSYSDLQSYYETEWVLKFHHGYSLQEQAMMHPYERDLHVMRITNHLKRIKEAQKT